MSEWHICQFSRCQYSHHGWFKATNIRSLKIINWDNILGIGDSQDCLPLIQYNQSPAKTLGTILQDAGHALSQCLTYDAMSKVTTIHRSIAQEFEVGLGILTGILIVSFSESVLLNPMTRAPTELESLAPREERSPGNNPGRIPRRLEVRSASGRFDLFKSVQWQENRKG